MAKSMQLNVAGGLSSLLKEGYKHMEGVDAAVAKNIDAVKQLAAITRTSLGPNGMNKLVINHLEKVFITSDTATILTELDVVHPAAKMIVMAAKMQESEYGDGTCFVVSFAGQLLQESATLLRKGLHTSEIVAGYQKAYEKFEELCRTDIPTTEAGNVRDVTVLAKIAKTSLTSKKYGYEDFLSGLVAAACLHVMPSPPKQARINVDNIRVSKIKGGTLMDSSVIKGMIIQRSPEGAVKKADKAKVVVFGCGIEVSSTEAKSTVLIKNAEELQNYNKGEEKLLEDAVRSIAESGAHVVISGGSISEMALHFLEKYKLMALKLTSKWELRRICRAVNATALVRLGAPTPEEMGYCDKVHVREIGGKKVTVFEQLEEEYKMSTIVLRASTDNTLNDVERAIDDGVNCIRAACKSGVFVAGAGATEIELARKIQEFGGKSSGLEQYSIKKFAEAMEIVPRILAENSGKMASQILSNLHAAHAAGNACAGIDIENAEDNSIIPNCLDKNIWDHLDTKMSAIRLATDAAITVLRVDQIIMAKEAGGPKPRGA